MYGGFSDDVEPEHYRTYSCSPAKFSQGDKERKHQWQQILIEILKTPPRPLLTGNFYKPSIAAVNGPAVGEGLTISLCCDIRIASENAKFGYLYVLRGIVGNAASAMILPQIVGLSRALEMMYSGEMVDATEAEKIGLVSKVIARENLSAEADAMARTIAAKGPIALTYAKEAINKGLDLTLDQGLRLEGDLYFLLHTTSDRQEGITAFREKRPPQISGK